MAALFIDQAMQAKIDAIVADAAATPLDMHRLTALVKTRAGKRKHMQRMNSLSVDIPIGYLATYSVEKQRHGLARHLSVSVTRQGKMPNPVALWMIAEAFGFTGSLQHCEVWLEELQRDEQRVVAPNIVQYMDLDSSGIA